MTWLVNVLLELGIRATIPDVQGHWIDVDGHSEISQEAYDLERWSLPVLQERRQFQFEPMLEVMWHHRLNFARHPKRPTIVYVRDPRDAIYSCYRRHFTEAMSFAEFLRRPDSCTCHFPGLFGLPPAETWAYFDLFWLAMGDVMKIKVVTFEAMRADDVGVTKDVLAFLGVERTDEEITRALERSTFERAKNAMEQVQSETGQPFHTNRRGKVGEWQEIYSAQDLECFDGPAAYAMQWLGYDVPVSLRSSFPTSLSELRQMPVCTTVQQCVDTARGYLAAGKPVRAMDVLRESLPPDAEPSGEHAALLNAMVALRWTVAIFSEQDSASAAALRAFDLFYDLNFAFCSSPHVEEVLRHARYGWSDTLRTLETDYAGYNIVHYHHTFFAVKQELGSTDVYSISPQELSEYTRTGSVLTDITPEALKRRFRQVLHQELPDILQRVIGTNWGLTEAEQEALFPEQTTSVDVIAPLSIVSERLDSLHDTVEQAYAARMESLSASTIDVLHHAQNQVLSGQSESALASLRCVLDHADLSSNEFLCVLCSYAAIVWGQSISRDASMYVSVSGTVFQIFRDLNVYFIAYTGVQRALIRVLALPDAVAEAQYFARLGEALFAVEEWTGAENALQQGLDRDPSSSLLYNDLTVLCWKQGRPAQALAHLEMALRLDPHNPDALANANALFAEVQRLGV
jgi:tetratricopeptide (TPR) repeat protein